MEQKGTIILTSSGGFLTQGDLSFLPKPINEMKIAQVITASKAVDDISYIEKHQRRMRDCGMDFKAVDIDRKKADELEDLFADRDLIMVEGGNTFYLLKAVRESHFDETVKKLLPKGVIYMGASAGAYIACPTIEVSAWKNKHDQCGVTDYKAMNLVPFLVFAHYDTEYEELLMDKMRTANYPVKILNDDQAIACQDGKYRLIGEGEEIKL